MTEAYTGPRFTTHFLARKIPKHSGIIELSEWSKTFAVLGLVPEVPDGFAGNLSFRTKDGFIITAAGANLENLRENDIVEVTDVDDDKRETIAIGKKEPSSESFLHHAIYQKRSDVHAIFHIHDEEVLNYQDKLHLPVTENEQPYGTLKLVKEVLKVFKHHNYIIIKNHGILSLGNTMERAGQEALRLHNQAIRFQSLQGG